MISLKKASRYLIAINALKNTLFILPVIMLYYGYKGVDIGDFFFIQGCSLLLVFFLEVPTGYIGDLFSRKNVLIGGTIAWICGYLCWIFGYGFWWILLGELIFAVAISLISGTLEAYLYDLLKKNNKEKNFHNKLAKMETVKNFVLMVCTFSGSFIYYAVGPDLTVALTVFALIIAIVLLCFMPDVPEAKRIVKDDKSKIQDILDISKYAVKHPQIKYLLFYPSIYGALTLILMWGLQSVMIEANVPVMIFSIVFGINAMGRTFWSAISGKLLDKIGLNGIVKLSNVIISVAIIGAIFANIVPENFVYIFLLLMICGAGSHVLVGLATSTIINHRVKSDERATVLSVKSMIGRLATGISMILLKPLFDNLGISETFMISGLLILPIFYVSYNLVKLNLKIKD